MTELADSLAKLISPEPNTGCWLWMGTVVSHGYGQVRLGGRGVQAHIAVFEEVHGKVPDGLELDHLCRVPCCVNPDHLETVTHQENCRRGRGGENMRSKTHCPQGHPYSGDNLYAHAGRRHCWTCLTKRKRARELWRRKNDREYRARWLAYNRELYQRRKARLSKEIEIA